MESTRLRESLGARHDGGSATRRRWRAATGCARPACPAGSADRAGCASRTGGVHAAAPQRRHLQPARRHDWLAGEQRRPAGGRQPVRRHGAQPAERAQGAQPAADRRPHQQPPPSRSHRWQRRAASRRETDRRARPLVREPEGAGRAHEGADDAARPHLPRHLERHDRRRDGAGSALGPGPYRRRRVDPLRAGQHRAPGRSAQQPRLSQRRRAGRGVGARLDPGAGEDGAGLSRRRALRLRPRRSRAPVHRHAPRPALPARLLHGGDRRWRAARGRKARRGTSWRRSRCCRSSSISEARSRGSAWR